MQDEPLKREPFSAYTNKADRTLRPAQPVEEELGPLELLPGVWSNLRDSEDPDNFGKNPFAGRGWNMIALPFAKQGERRPFRMLMNQYNEELVFSTVDDNVPNRGVTADRSERADQFVAALDYEQSIRQIKAEDISVSGDAGDPGLAIHHEPGLFLHMKPPQQIDGIDIARLGTIPHGNAINAIGRSEELNGAPTIPNLSGFLEGFPADDILTAVKNASDPEGYLFPYHKYTVDPFEKAGNGPNDFPGFGPENANAPLQFGMGFIKDKVTKTTVLDFSTELDRAGIVNIPFIERQADAAQLKSTFWIMELDEEGPMGTPHLVMAYSQFIYLDFFDRFDGKPGLIRWPHISINMMEKVAPPPGANTAYTPLVKY